MSDQLPSWNDTPTKHALVGLVDAVTTEGSDAFVPEFARVAVFDNDGTLSTENPYMQLAFAVDRAGQLGRPATTDDLRAGGLPAVLELLKLTHGSTDGDLPTLQWTAASPYRSLQLVVHHTDATREYAYDTDPLLGSGTEQLLAAASRGDWTVADMAADWSEMHPAVSR